MLLQSPTLKIFPGRTDGQGGVTLLELLVAMLILVMVSAMLYSVLNVGIGFSRKGEARTIAAARERAFLGLLHRQVQGAWFDRKERKPVLDASGYRLKLVTSAPLLNRDLGVVLAVYRYDPKEDVLYYAEKKDYYNADFRENYEPDRKDMLVLMREVGGLSLEYQADSGTVMVRCRGREYGLPVRCWLPEVG